MQKNIVKELASYDGICQLEFNSRKYTIRIALKITNLFLGVKGGQIIDVIPAGVGEKSHLIVLKDCYEHVYVDSVPVGMNVYERENVIVDDLTCGVSIVRFKCVNYFSDDARRRAEKKMSSRYEQDDCDSSRGIIERAYSVPVGL